MFARLDEPDGVAGVMAIQQIEPSIEQRILSLEVSGKLADAAACYERTDQPMKLEHLKVDSLFNNFDGTPVHIFFSFFFTKHRA